MPQAPLRLWGKFYDTLTTKTVADWKNRNIISPAVYYRSILVVEN